MNLEIVVVFLLLCVLGLINTVVYYMSRRDYWLDQASRFQYLCDMYKNRCEVQGAYIQKFLQSVPDNHKLEALDNET